MKRIYQEFTSRATPASSHRPRVAIQSRGNISLNYAAYQLLGEPESVVFVFHPKDRIIGLKPSNASVRHSYPVRKQNGSRSYLMNAQAFCSHIGIDISKTRAFEPFMDGEVLAFELSKGMEVHSGRKRKSTTVQDEKSELPFGFSSKGSGASQAL